MTLSFGACLGMAPAIGGGAENLSANWANEAHAAMSVRVHAQVASAHKILPTLFAHEPKKLILTLFGSLYVLTEHCETSRRHPPGLRIF